MQGNSLSAVGVCQRLKNLDELGLDTESFWFIMPLFPRHFSPPDIGVAMNRTRFFSAFTYCAIVYFAMFAVCQPSAGASQDRPAALMIKVLEGEDGVNIIKTKSAVKPVVQVTDRNNLPVAGASVVFLLPSSGPSAAFANGARTLTVVTNQAGRAAVTSMNPAGGVGPFQINVTASFQGEVATASIAQTNFATVAAATAAGVSVGAGTGLSTLGIVGIVAGAAAAATGIAVAKGGGKPSGTIGVGGTPTLGPSH
jgi:hypothetical protein